jgi:predicted ATPase
MSVLEAKPYLRTVYLKRKEIPSFDGYPFILPVIKNFKEITFHPDVTFIIGDNGAGKSTLIEAIAILLGFNAEGGSRNFRFETQKSHSSLYKFLHATKSYKMPTDGFFLRAESFYNAASYLDNCVPAALEYYGGKSLHAQSHGESFWSLLIHRFGGRGLYILDEPESALSPSRQLSMLSRMHQLVLAESQFIIATHSPILLSYPRAKIYTISEGILRECAYEDTEHYKVSARFFKSHKKYLDLLCKDEEI